jgi:hypothetical protein
MDTSLAGTGTDWLVVVGSEGPETLHEALVDRASHSVDRVNVVLMSGQCGLQLSADDQIVVRVLAMSCK